MIVNRALRRQLYREGKRVLGTERMARLRARSLRLGRATARREARLRDRVRSRGRRRWARIALHERIGSDAHLLLGEIETGGAALDTVRLHTGTGETLDVASRLHRFQTDDDRRRADGHCRGIALYIDGVDTLSVLRADIDGHTVELMPSDATRLQAPANAGVAVLPRVRRILEALPRHKPGRRALFDAAVGPALTRLWSEARARRDTSAGELRRYGPTANGPVRTSIVIPIYGRCDYIEHQLAHFEFDASLDEAELLYVLDDPRLTGSVQAMAERLARSCRRPFSVLYLPENLGYAGANNAGARHARGRHLLLMNSDVLPAESGWLERLYTSLGGPLEGTLLGARLLYPDGCIQHDGMALQAADSHEGQYLNRHPGKGLPADLFDVDVHASERTAVTGACLLLSLADWQRLGGFDESYIVGDFEDSDLCLAARSAGMAIHMASDARLFHIERQSQSMVAGDRWKELLTYYNCWFQTRKWQSELDALSAETAR